MKIRLRMLQAEKNKFETPERGNKQNIFILSFISTYFVETQYLFNNK